MRFNTPKGNTYERRLRFALWPTRIGDKIVWLEFYRSVYYFAIKPWVKNAPHLGEWRFERRETM